jgi:maleylpyruvate isomerase
MIELYTFFRSGTSHRLRIALALKGVDVAHIPVDLRTEDHSKAPYKAINPQGLVPALKVEEKVLTQSPSIIEWLEETYPEPSFLPKDAFDRQYVRAIASLVGCDIHPVNNRRILEYLRAQFNANEEQILQWCASWIVSGFDALETMLVNDGKSGKFCYGDQPSLADIYLIPQVESARRFKIDMSRWPKIQSIDEICLSLPAFINAAPAKQKDAS